MITLGISLFSLYLICKYGNKIGKNSQLFSFLLMINLFVISMVLASLIGFNGGIGGSPYMDYMEEF